MIYTFLRSVEEYLLAKKLYKEYGDALHEKLLRTAKCTVRRCLKELHGEDYTAGLDLLAERMGEALPLRGISMATRSQDGRSRS